MPLSWVEIDLAALRHNWGEAARRLGERTFLVGVVKSDAYGHGMVPVSRELVACGARFLAVSKYWEARELRARGIHIPLIVLLGLERQDVEDALLRDVRPVIFRVDHARMVHDVALKMGRKAPVHVKVDTGMNRLGVVWDELPRFLDEIASLGGLEIEGVISHFAAADEADKAYCQDQVQCFESVLRAFGDRGIRPPYAHISNSAGLLDLPHAHFQLVRPGIMLYGSQPSSDLLQPAGLKPVMTFKSRVLQLKTVPPDRPIGYGRTYRTRGVSRVATVPVGYDDGYSRLLSNRGAVLVRGVRAPVVGRVSMNMITVDVTHIGDVQPDDEVVLLGRQGDERITAEELAALCDTISYEIFCSIGKNRHKYFLGASEGDCGRGA
ncbi:MAG: alanine racemase [Syntrophobacteraceae bacterium]|jgi:alanine racemase|nr:alanine racemase [Syntrophobacteraceae bacterium]